VGELIEGPLVGAGGGAERTKIARLQVVAQAHVLDGMTPTRAVEREVGGHLDNYIGANSGVCSTWRSPAVRRQPLGPRVGLLLEEPAQSRGGGWPEGCGATG
jgi:hypothetical protein